MIRENENDELTLNDELENAIDEVLKSKGFTADIDIEVNSDDRFRDKYDIHIHLFNVRSR